MKPKPKPERSTIKQDRVARFDAIYAAADRKQQSSLDTMIINIQLYMSHRPVKMSFGIGMAKELIVSMMDHLPAWGEGWAWETLHQLKGVEVGEVNGTVVLENG